VGPGFRRDDEVVGFKGKELSMEVDQVVAWWSVDEEAVRARLSAPGVG